MLIEEIKDKVFNEIDKRLEEKDSVVIALDGMSHSGKTFLASLIKDKYQDVRIIHIDDFYLPRDSKIKNQEYDGNIDYKRLKEEVISKLDNNELLYRKFSCQSQQIVEEYLLKRERITIIEGTYSLNPILGDYFNFSIFLEITLEDQMNRLKVRNLPNFNDFVNKWLVYEKLYFKRYNIRNKVDLYLTF